MEIDNTTIVKLTAIVSLTILGALAFYKNIDHGLIASISAIIGGLAGYEFGSKKGK